MSDIRGGDADGFSGKYDSAGAFCSLRDGGICRDFDRGGDIGDIMSPPPGELPPGLAAVDADTDIDKALRMWHATAAKWSTG